MSADDAAGLIARGRPRWELRVLAVLFAREGLAAEVVGGGLRLREPAQAAEARACLRRLGLSEGPAEAARRRLPVVAVLGSGSAPHAERARPLGKLLAGFGVHLLTGGGGGVMAEVARAFTETQPREGLSIGILPGDPASGEPPPGYPNSWVELAVRTHLPGRGGGGAGPDSRNHLNVLSGDVLVFLPGGAGTASELELAARYGRPILLFAGEPPAIPARIPDRARRAADLAALEEALALSLCARLRAGEPGRGGATP